jgi:hypothetical protein
MTIFSNRNASRGQRSTKRRWKKPGPWKMLAA